jgi:hypothetical protein
LGDLSDAERQLCEERLFADDEYFERLLQTEDELFDAYARGEIEPQKRAQFERRLLSSPKQRQKLRLAKALAGLTTEASASEAVAPTSSVSASRWLAPTALLRSPFWAFALATLVVALGALWLLAQNSRLHQRLEMVENERALEQQRARELEEQVSEQRARNDELAAQLQRGQGTQPVPSNRQPGNETSPSEGTPHTSATSAVVSLLLSPSIVRGAGEAKELPLPQTTERLQLQLELEEGDEYQSYAATLDEAQGKTVWQRDGLRARKVRGGRIINLQLPAGLLAAGKYEVQLSGRASGRQPEPVAYYYFSVTPRQ